MSGIQRYNQLQKGTRTSDRQPASQSVSQSVNCKQLVVKHAPEPLIALITTQIHFLLRSRKH